MAPTPPTPRPRCPLSCRRRARRCGAGAVGSLAPHAAALSRASAPPLKQPRDVMVLVWPGGRIEQLPRGTTAGEVVARLGSIQILAPASGEGADSGTRAGEDPPWPPTPCATGLSLACHFPQATRLLPPALPAPPSVLVPTSAPLICTARPPPRDLVNVNNRLVPGDTPLADGDLVVLTRELLKI